MDNFAEVMSRLRAGDAEAAVAVFNRFAQRLIGLARAHLEQVIRRKEDPEDIIQSVYRSFFRRHQAGQFQLDSWDSLWVVLTVMTLRKCGNHIEYFHAARRDVLRESPLSSETTRNTIESITACDPTPSQAVILAETVETLLSGLETFDRDVLVLQLQGYTLSEIGVQVSRVERTVRRAIVRIRKRLSRLQSAVLDCA